MAIDKITYAAAKKYTDKSIAGGGAIKGKNCIIDSISPITGGQRVTFEWELDDGTVQTANMDVMNGIGVRSVDINESNHLIVTFDDGTTHDAGEITGGGTGDVISVNGKKGTVVLYGTDILMSNDPGSLTIPLAIDQLQGSLANKVDKVPGKGLSTNDYDDNSKDKLDSLPNIKSIGAGLNLNSSTGELTATGIPIDIDEHLDPTSTNPVQNKAIAIPMEALQGSVLDIELDISQLQGSVLDIQSSLSNKVDKVPGKGLSTEDYTTADLQKLRSLLGIESIGDGLNFDDSTGKLTATGAAITIDPTLDKTSTNAIQNKAVAVPIEALQGSVLDIKLDISQLQGSLANKVDKVPGKGLSTEDYTTADLQKLRSLLELKSVGTGLNFDSSTGELTATGISIDIDEHLDTTSINPVQNKAIAIPMEALQGSVLDIELDISQLQGSVLSLRTNKVDRSDLGTAAFKNVPESGDASSSEVVLGNDSRLTDSRNAKDVYAWAKEANKPTYTASEVGAVATTDIGASNGVAPLGSDMKVPAANLPSYVDDVLEYLSISSFPVTGESGKIYVDTSTNKTYRWSGSTYVEISESLALGETSSTAYAGNKGKENADAISTIEGLIPSSASSSNKLATANDVPTDLSQLSDDATHRLVTDSEKTTWNTKDEWTQASLVQSDNTVTFSNLSDSYGYDLYCENKLPKIVSMVKTGSGTSVQLVYTLSDVVTGDSCKLRILK